MPTYPVSSDYWAEFTTTPSGGHWVPYADTYVEVDLVVKAVGVGSIHVKTRGTDLLYSGASFYIDDGLEFDGTRPNAQLRSKIDLRTSAFPGFTGQCRILLSDNQGSIVAKLFSQTPNDQFVDKSYELGEGKDWVVIQGSFNWTKIKNVTFECDLTPSQSPQHITSGEFNIDLLYFYYEYPQTIRLNVNSEPSGKQIILDGNIPGTTPVAWGVNAGQHTVKVEPNSFQKWEDNTTNTERTLDVQSPITITAYYAGGGGQAIWPLIAVASGAIVLLLIWQYKK